MVPTEREGKERDVVQLSRIDKSLFFKKKDGTRNIQDEPGASCSTIKKSA